MTETSNVFAEFLARYGPAAGEEGPVLFVREVLGVEPSPWQERGLRAYGRGERRISVRSAHGVGKTAFLSWCVVHSLVTRYPQKTVATAPTSAQIYDALFAEVVTWVKKLPEPLRALFDIKSDRIELVADKEQSFFSARTARPEKPEALAGVHCDAGWVLLIADEASGVADPIFETAAGSMSGTRATTILAGNPVRTMGLFFDSHHKLRDMWYTLHVSGVPDTEGEYSPRVDPDFITDISRRYGTESNAYRVRCLGEFPRGDLDAIIPYELIVAAQDRDIDVPDNSPEVWALDVARFGDDECVLIRRNKLAVNPHIEAWTKRDTMYTTGRVKRTWDDTPAPFRPEVILIDVIGIGSGVVDRLREMGLPARGVNVSETDSVDPQYRNLRTELVFRAKDWLESRARKLPTECACETCKLDRRNDHAQQLAEDLAAQRLGYTSSGKQLAMAKDEVKKIIGRSPNVGDAFCITFASEPAALMGSNKRHAWNKPIRRNLRGIV